MKPPSVTSDLYGSQRSISIEVQVGLQKSIQSDDISQVVITDPNKSPPLDDSDVFQNDRQPYDESSRDRNDVPHPQDGVDDEISAFQVMKISFTRIPWKLYLALLLTKLIPTIYRTTRVYYLGDLPEDGGVNIASQLSWVNLLLEVVQESLILPLFYMIGVTIDDEMETKNRVKSGVIFTFLVHIVFSVIIVVAAEPLVRFMAQDEDLITDTVTYIRLEMAAIPFNGVVQFVTVVFTLYQWKLHIYTILGLRLFISVVLDTFFLSSFDFSLQFGVNGIAYGNIIANGVICFYCLIVLATKFRTTCKSLFAKMSFTWMRTWGTVGFYSGLDSFVRNIFYMLCVVRMMNVIAEQGTYWLANEFIWNWLLVSFLPLADVLKQDTGASTSPVMRHTHKMAGYLILTVTIGILWCASIPAWKPFFETVMNVPPDDVDVVFQLVLILMPSYIVYMVNTLMDSVFIGKGKTEMLAIQSIITNLCVYGVSFTLYLCGIYTPTLINIAVLFGSGILMDSAITTGLYFWYVRKVNYRI